MAHYTTQNSSLSSDLVQCITLINGRIWAGTDGGGINIINPVDGSIQVLEHESGNIHTLPVNTICIYMVVRRETISGWVPPVVDLSMLGRVI